MAWEELYYTFYHRLTSAEHLRTHFMDTSQTCLQIAHVSHILLLSVIVVSFLFSFSDLRLLALP